MLHGMPPKKPVSHETGTGRPKPGLQPYCNPCPTTKIDKNLAVSYRAHLPQIESPPTHEAAPLGQPAPRIWPHLFATAEPAYVCYKRLWFEQRNSERYAWDFGVLQPFLSTGVFYTDLALLPLHWLTDPCR